MSAADSLGRMRHALRRAADRPWLAVLLGVAFALLGLTPGYIAGSGPYWQQPSGDTATAQIGWQYYARDEWRWPLFAVGNYHDPEGSTVSLSDSLPLFALPAKAIYRASGWMPTYVGLWVALCLASQAVCALRLLVALGVDGVAGRVGGVLLFCYAPILLIRYGHATLMCQFLILIALERYVTAKRDGGLSARGWVALGVLPALAVLTHPYMAVMCAALVFATVVDQWRERRLSLAAAAARLGGSAALTLFVAVVGGIYRGGGRPFTDYGVYSLNLAAPFVPLAGTRLGFWLGTHQPNLPGTHQWEGTAYLGAGVLLLGLFALPALRNARANLRRHGVLLAVVAALLVFAASNRVGVGAHELVRVPLPSGAMRALSVFRGSGRFVWIAVYALLGAVLAAIAARYGTRRGAPLIAAAAALQVADVQPMQAAMRDLTAHAAPATLDVARWTELIAAHDRVFEFPSFECGGLFGNGIPGTRLRELEIDWIAARQGVPTNSAYLARAIKDCARERADAAANAGRPGVLYLYRSSGDVGGYLAAHGVDVSRCGDLDDVVVCSADRDLSGLRSEDVRAR